jgi:hypothetical protein
MSNVNDLWKSEPTPEVSSGGELPDGKYTVKVNACVEKETKETGKPMIAWDMVVVEGQPYARKHVFMNRVLDAERKESIGWAKSDFKKIGIDADALPDIQSCCTAALDRVIEIQVKTRGEYTNVYVNKMVDVADTPF